MFAKLIRRKPCYVKVDFRRAITPIAGIPFQLATIVSDSRETCSGPEPTLSEPE